MKNEARDAVANLRQLLDEMDAIRLEMDRQIDILEAIDDNDIMEHAYSQTKDWEPGEVYELYPVDDDPDTLRMEQVQPQDC